ncbi:DUF2442 domain-containing protein [Runella sp.]|uniref:DUF2442 domain-containing protein n=1 Tax=Runella sp. TaxID=1960881 RepID=UPI002624CD49|nr:DUF2442 domain-containing protein [Runella sp.]
MNPRVIKVKPLENHELELLFSNHETRIFDIKPYLIKGIFSELADETVFNSVKSFNGTVVWSNELDFCPDTLYIDSVKK